MDSLPAELPGLNNKPLSQTSPNVQVLPTTLIQPCCYVREWVSWKSKLYKPFPRWVLRWSPTGHLPGWKLTSQSPLHASVIPSHRSLPELPHLSLAPLPGIWHFPEAPLLALPQVVLLIVTPLKRIAKLPASLIGVILALIHRCARALLGGFSAPNGPGPGHTIPSEQGCSITPCFLKVWSAKSLPTTTFLTKQNSYFKENINLPMIKSGISFGQTLKWDLSPRYSQIPWR